jgi:hypothetical protein
MKYAIPAGVLNQGKIALLSSSSVIRAKAVLSL